MKKPQTDHEHKSSGPGKGSFPAGLNAFVDMSHHKTDVDLARAKDAGLVGLMHKLTQGTCFVDDRYPERLKQARASGLLVGAYHFLTGEDVETQLDFFLDNIQTYGQENIVPMIDWEDNPDTAQGSMSLDALKQFLILFYEKTRIHPVIYGGYWMLYQLANETDPQKILGSSPLWQAFYSRQAGILTDIWDDWTFIQYTDGTLGPGPHEFTGIGKVDRNCFNGNSSDAKEFWNQNSLK